MHDCPVCNAIPDAETLTCELGVSLNPDNLVTYQGKSTHLPPRLSELMAKLIKAYPRGLAAERLMPVDHHDRRGLFFVNMSRVRSLIQDIGLGISGKNPGGYVLTTKPRTVRSKKTWLLEDKLELIRLRNSGMSWKDVGAKFGVEGANARSLANVTAIQHNLPLVRREQFKSKGPGSRLQPAHKRNNKKVRKSNKP
jgi:hypothetical protein